MASKKRKILLFFKTYQEVISDPEVTWKWPGSDRKWPGSEFGSDHKMSKFAFFVVHTYQEVTSNPEVTRIWTRKWPGSDPEVNPEVTFLWLVGRKNCVPTSWQVTFFTLRFFWASSLRSFGQMLLFCPPRKGLVGQKSNIWPRRVAPLPKKILG